MSNKKYTWEEIHEGWIKNEMCLHGNRIGVLRMEGKDEIKGIIVPDQFVRDPRSGHVVCFGNDFDWEKSVLDAGTVVCFNKYNAVEFELELDGFEEPVKIDVLHEKDIYISFEES